MGVESLTETGSEEAVKSFETMGILKSCQVHGVFTSEITRMSEAGQEYTGRLKVKGDKA